MSSRLIAHTLSCRHHAQGASGYVQPCPSPTFAELYVDLFHQSTKMCPQVPEKGFSQGTSLPVCNPLRPENQGFLRCRRGGITESAPSSTGSPDGKGIRRTSWHLSLRVALLGRPSWFKFDSRSRREDEVTGLCSIP